MAAVGKTIGATARDYATVALWQAADGGGDGLGNDDCTGTIYADSDFDEDVTINFSANDIVLTVAAADRHDGTANSGARFLQAGADSSGLNLEPPDCSCLVEWLEFDFNDKDATSPLEIDPTSPNVGTFKNILGHGIVDSSPIQMFYLLDPARILNCICYDIESTDASGDDAYFVRVYSGVNDETSIYNNTFGGIVHPNGTGDSYGIDIDDDNAGKNVKNTIAFAIASGGGTAEAFDYAGTTNSVIDYCLDDDSTLPDTGNNQRGKTVTDQFVAWGGPYNLHLVAGASDAIDLGTDLGTTPTGVEVDIDGRDRDAEGDTWDIGADEYVAAGGNAMPMAIHHYQMAGAL